jgi:hypothetical protein
MSKPLLFHDIDGVLFGEYDGDFQLRPGVKTWLKWAHEHFQVVFLTSWSPDKIRTLLSVIYSEKFIKNLSDPPVPCANWTGYSNKVEWLSKAVPKLQGREWYWIDDEVRTYAKEIEELKLPTERCIQVSEKGAGALEELRGELEKLRYEKVVKALG